jgi:hypothetical protein
MAIEDKADYEFAVASPAPRAPWSSDGEVELSAVEGKGLSLVGVFTHRSQAMPQLDDRYTQASFRVVSAIAQPRESDFEDHELGWRMALDDGHNRCELRLGRDPLTGAQQVVLAGSTQAPIPFSWDREVNLFRISRRTDGSIELAIGPEAERRSVVRRIFTSGSLAPSRDPGFQWGMTRKGGGEAFWKQAVGVVEVLERPSPESPGGLSAQLRQLKVGDGEERIKVEAMFTGAIPQLPRPVTVSLSVGGEAQPFWSVTARELSEGRAGFEIARQEARRTGIKRLSIGHDGSFECVDAKPGSLPAELSEVDLTIEIGDAKLLKRGLAMRQDGQGAWILA